MFAYLSHVVCILFLISLKGRVVDKLPYESPRTLKQPLPHNTVKFDSCDIPCWVQKTIPLVGTVVVYDEFGRSSSFKHSMEGEKHYPTIKDKGNNDALSTTAFKSEVPIPYYSLAEYTIDNPQVSWGDAIKGAVFIARNCRSLNDREGLVRRLGKYIQVDAISTCLHNTDWPRGIARTDKHGAMGKYLFYLAFENESTEDYITEKLWGGIGSGALPIYFGAPNALDHVPKNSIITISHATVDVVGPLLARLTEDEKLYNVYHEWRNMPLDNFNERYAMTTTHSHCRKCRWNKFNHNRGLYRWDQKNQQVVIR